VVCRTVPEILIAPFGGLLADRCDRRKLMICLDLIAAIAVLGYIYAMKSESVSLLYVATIVRSIISATYMPVTQSIVPMLVVDKDDLKRAGSINGIVWSGMMLLGGIIAGNATARFGVEVCYIIDSITFIISAFFIAKIRGCFRANKRIEDNNKVETKLHSLRIILRMKIELFRYLKICGFGLLVFVKATGSFVWGPADVLNVSFSHVENDEAESSRRMGVLYSAIGAGCLLGPLLANSTIVDAHKPKTFQLAILCGLLFMFSGWIGIGNNTTSFNSVCAFTMLRTVGSAVIWIFSTILLQNLSSQEYLGRIMGLEYCLARISETSIALITGRLKDNGLSDKEMSYMAGSFAGTFFLLWSIYHAKGNGANQHYFNSEDTFETTETPMENLIP